MKTDEALLLTEPKAAKLLSISPRKLWGMEKAGEVPCVRLGGRKLYDRDDLQRLIEARKTQQAC